MNYLNIIKQFNLNGTALSYELYGEGHINQTYYVITDKGSKYIMQKINHNLFKDISALMRNIQLVTEHLEKKEKERGQAYKGLKIVRTNNNAVYYEDNGEYFRVYDFIDNATAHQNVTDPKLFYESAVAFGNFQNDLQDFNSLLLVELLPGFHNTEKRFSDFEASLKADIMGRAKSVQKEIDFVLKRKNYCNKITSLLKNGDIPTRVTHNDTKLNNVMLDNKTGKAVAVIDLDTVMPGSCCYDFGDSIRFGCKSAAEDEPDTEKVNFNINLYKTYTEGYLSVLKNITPLEKENLAFSSILMTYECGMRFLKDYLDGDIYFRLTRERQNLDRARTQFKLVSDMENCLDEMKFFTEKN